VTAVFIAVTAGAGRVANAAPATLTSFGVAPFFTTAIVENPPGAFVINVAVRWKAVVSLLVDAKVDASDERRSHGVQRAAQRDAGFLRALLEELPLLVGDNSAGQKTPGQGQAAHTDEHRNRHEAQSRTLPGGRGRLTRHAHAPPFGTGYDDSPAMRSIRPAMASEGNG